MLINPAQLYKELFEAGINVNGCNSDGVIWDKDNNEIQGRADVKAIVLAHKPVVIIDQSVDQKMKDLEQRMTSIETKVNTLTTK